MSKRQQFQGQNQNQQLAQRPSLNLLQTIQQQVQLLRRLSIPQLHYLQQNHEIIIFNKDTTLAKQQQTIDYVGMILSGQVFCEKSKRELGKGGLIGIDVIGGEWEQKHKENIVGVSDGIVLAVRLEWLIGDGNCGVSGNTQHVRKNNADTMSGSKSNEQLLAESVKSKLVSFLAQCNLSLLKDLSSAGIGSGVGLESMKPIPPSTLHLQDQLRTQFEQLDPRITQKLIQSSRPLSTLLEQFQPHERSKLLEYFPLQCAKQSTQILSKNSGCFLLLVVKGEIALKLGELGSGLKKQTKIIQTGTLYNTQGYIYNHTQHANGYCSSNQAVFLMIDKAVLTTNFGLGVQATMCKYCLEYERGMNQYVGLEELMEKNQRQMQQEIAGSLNGSNINSNFNSNSIWTPFMKSYKIQELPSKTNKKPSFKNNISFNSSKSGNTTLNNNSKNNRSMISPTNKSIIQIDQPKKSKSKKQSLSTLQTLYKMHQAVTAANRNKHTTTGITNFNNSKTKTNESAESGLPATAADRNQNIKIGGKAGGAFSKPMGSDSKRIEISGGRNHSDMMMNEHINGKGNGADRLRSLQKQINTLKDQLKIMQESYKQQKLELMQSQSRLGMVELMKQVRALASGGGSMMARIRDGPKGINSTSRQQSTTSTSTLKQVFEDTLKRKKLDLLVAKCGYKWLEKTRKNRQKRQKQQRVPASFNNSMQMGQATGQAIK